MGFSVSDGRGDFEYAGTPLGLFARPANLLSPSFLGMLRDWRRFNREAPAMIGTAPSLEQQGFSRHFVGRLIVRVLRNHGMFSLRDRPSWRTVSGGSISYVEAIAAPWREWVRLGGPGAAARQPALLRPRLQPGLLSTTTASTPPENG